MLLAGALLSAAPAGAQPAPNEDEARARALFEEGQIAVSKGELERARTLFVSSRLLYPTAGTLLNLADCEEKLGFWASAWRHFREAIETLRPGDDRIPFAKSREAALQKKLPMLLVELRASAPAGTRVLFDGGDLPEPGLGARTPVDPGPHTIIVRAPQRLDRTYEVTLSEKEQVTLTVEPEPKPGPPPPPPARPLRTAGFVTGGVGLVGVGVGAAFGILAVQKKSELSALCPVPAHCTPVGVQMAEEGQLLGNAATAGLALGLTFLTAGGILLLVGSSDRPATAQVSVSPQGARLSLGGSF